MRLGMTHASVSPMQHLFLPYRLQRRALRRPWLLSNLRSLFSLVDDYLKLLLLYEFQIKNLFVTVMRSWRKVEDGCIAFVCIIISWRSWRTAKINASNKFPPGLVVFNFLYSFNLITNAARFSLLSSFLREIVGAWKIWKLQRKGNAWQALRPWVQDSSKKHGLTWRPGTLIGLRREARTVSASGLCSGPPYKAR